MNAMPVIGFVVLAILNILDAALTVVILDRGGRERNPPLAWLMTRLGIIPALALVKLLALTIVGAFLAELGMLLWAFVAVYAAVVVHNWRQLGRMPIL